jgi:gephyrin
MVMLSFVICFFLKFFFKILLYIHLKLFTHFKKKASDGPGIYPVVSISHAGDLPKPTRLQAKQITRITTGAPVPLGADAVVMVEATTLISSKDGEEQFVHIHESAKAGQNIRSLGCDYASGSQINFSKKRITATEVGILASMGLKQVCVFSQPRVAVLSTGNEVVNVQESMPNELGIYDANRPALLSALKELNIPCKDVGIVKDEESLLFDAISKSLKMADVLITTGGVSMGEKDWIKSILQTKLKAKIHFGRVLLKPGKPTTFATLNCPDSKEKKFLFCLPGNPVSALTTFYLFVQPCLKKSSGLETYENKSIWVTLGEDVILDTKRPEFQRAFVELKTNQNQQIELIALVTGNQRSSRMLSMLNANCLLRLPCQEQALVKTLKKGHCVEALLIKPLFFL